MESRQIAGYRIDDLLYESGTSVVYRACRWDTGQRVILKTVSEGRRRINAIDALHHEYDVLKRLPVEGVIAVYDMEEHDGRPVLVLEDFGGLSLKTYGGPAPWDLVQALHVAASIAGIIGRVHAKNIIHKDINPGNVVLNRETAAVKIIDFDMAGVFAREETVPADLYKIQGTLPYMSPEQTGRTSHQLDYRTDYYSLGVTLYELLCGKLPFETTDPLRLLHAHLALKPIPPRDVAGPDVPATVSEIVMKLMAKHPQERYQSAAGILADLEECIKQLEATGRVETFPVGTRDVSERFGLADKLYGRDDEYAALLAAFKRASHGAKELAVISGEPGVGKTRLAKELREPCCQEGGRFVSGKFEQFHKNVPCSALMGALRELVRQVLAQSEEEFRHCSENLAQTLYPNAQLLLELIPELEFIVGPQPTLPACGPVERRNRLGYALTRLVGALATAQNPLVLFIDDLQWADEPALDLLQIILSDPDINYVLVVAAYRDTDAPACAALDDLLKKLEPTGTGITLVRLGRLGFDAVVDLLRDSTLCTALSPSEPARALLRKTDGNPFHLRRFLEALYEDGAIELNSVKGVWEWNLETLEREEITANVAEFVAAKLRLLDPDTLELVQHAACLGFRFDLRVIGLVVDQTEDRMLKSLGEAVNEGLLVPTSEIGESSVGTSDRVEGLKTTVIKFSHDRIQQAALELIPSSERGAMHRHIGTRLLEKTSAAELPMKIFDIVHQLNKAVPQPETEEVRVRQAELNLIAGRRSMDSSAYEAAHHYLSAGIRLLDEQAWGSNYNLALALHSEGARAACLIADYETTDRLADMVIRRGMTVLDKVPVYETLVHGLIVRNKLLEAANLCMTVVRDLGIKIAPNPSKARVILGLMRTKALLRYKGISNLAGLPTATDPNMLAAMRLLSTAGPAAYMAAPTLIPLMIFKVIELSLRHGNAPVSPQAYASFGMIECGVTGNLEAGYGIGLSAMKTAERTDTAELGSRASFIFNYCVRHWKEHLSNSSEPLWNAYSVCLSYGDVEYAARAGCGHFT
ncbi:MAG: serine/threonine-protein kinase PknK, partial [Pseudomonadota bacterium]